MHTERGRFGKIRCLPSRIGLAPLHFRGVRTVRRVVASGLVALLAVVVPGPLASSAAAELPEMEPCVADAELVVGSAGGSVVCVQWTLMWLGYFHGLVDGDYGQDTFEAVIAYQQAEGLRANGHSDDHTLTAMGIYSGVDNAPAPPCLADAPVNPGDRGASTECVQQTLATLGYFSGTVDGAYGRSTQDAVKAYQLKNPPLTADGVAGTQTLAALGVWSGFTRGDAGDAIELNWFPAPMQAEPNWRVSQGIPYYNGRRACSKADADIIAREFAKDGADNSTQQFFIYIASREGSCNYQAVNYNLATKDDSHCTFQLNAMAGMFQPNAELGRRGWTPDNVKASMQNCADAASDLWVFCARGPWTPPYSCTPPWEGDLGPEGDA